MHEQAELVLRDGMYTTRIRAGAPPESVFDAVIHLRGLDLAQATTRLAGAAGIGRLPSHIGSEAGLASELDFLAGELARRAQGFTVRLWDPGTGQPAAPPITGHTGTVYAVCVVPGRQPGQPPALATAGYDGTVRLWDRPPGGRSGSR